MGGLHCPSWAHGSVPGVQGESGLKHPAKRAQVLPTAQPPTSPAFREQSTLYVSPIPKAPPPASVSSTFQGLTSLQALPPEPTNSAPLQTHLSPDLLPFRPRPPQSALSESHIPSTSTSSLWPHPLQAPPPGHGHSLHSSSSLPSRQSLSTSQRQVRGTQRPSLLHWKLVGGHEAALGPERCTQVRPGRSGPSFGSTVSQAATTRRQARSQELHWWSPFAKNALYVGLGAEQFTASPRARRGRFYSHAHSTQDT